MYKSQFKKIDPYGPGSHIFLKHMYVCVYLYLNIHSTHIFYGNKRLICMQLIAINRFDNTSA